MSKVTIYSPPATAQIKHCAVDFDLRREAVPIHLVQYDKTLPILEVSLYKGSVPYRLPDDAEANVRMGKRNNLIVYNPVLGCGENRDRVYIAITPQMTTQEGIFDPIVEVLVDGGLAGTSPMRLVVHRNPAQEDAIEDSSEAKSLDELVKQAAASAESARNDAEIAKQAEQTVEANAGNIQAVVDNLDAIKAAPGQAKAAAASAAAAQQAAQEALGFRTFFSAVTPDANGDLDPSRPMTTPSAASVTVKSKGDRIQSVQVDGFTTQAGTGDPSPANVREINTAGLQMLTAVMDGSEDEDWALVFQGNGFYATVPNFTNSTSSLQITGRVFSSYMPEITSTSIYNGSASIGVAAYTANNKLCLRIKGIASVQDLRDYLAQNPLTVWYVPDDLSQATGLYIPIQAQGHEYRCQMMELTAPLCNGDKVESCVPSGCNKRIVLDGSEDEGWISSPVSDGVYRWGINAGNVIPGLIAATSNASKVGVLSNQFVEMAADQTYKRVDGISVDTSGNLRVYDSSCYSDLIAWKEKLASNPLIVWYRSTAYTEQNDIPVQLETHQYSYKVLTGTESGWFASSVQNNRVAIPLTDAKASSSPICSVYNASSVAATPHSIYVDSNKNMGITDPRFTDIDTAKEILRSEQPQVVYTLANPAIYAHDPVTLVAVPYTDADVSAANQLANTPSMLPNTDSPDVSMLLDAANNVESAVVQTMALAANAVPVAGTYVVSSQDGTTVVVSLKAMQDGGDAATLGGMTLDEIKQLISDAVTAAVQMAQA